MRYSTVLFDADGTLFDYVAAMRSALEKTFAAFDLPYVQGAAELYDEINEGYWRMHERGEIEKEAFQSRRFEDLFGRLGAAGDSAAFNTAYLDALADCAVPVCGAEEVCAALFEAGVRLAIVTNGIARTQHRRVSLSLMARFFEGVFVSDEVGAAKPDPAFFDFVLDKMEIKDRISVLVVGDSLQADIAGGLASGLGTCWFNPEGKVNGTKFQPRHVAAELEEVLKIVL